jgi:hypothetical protein
MWLDNPASRTAMGNNVGQLMAERAPWLIRGKLD